MKQAFINLFDNAVAALNKNGKINIETTYDEILKFVRVWIVIYCGIIISILFSILAWSLLNTSFRARQIAETLTFDLGESEKRYRNLFESMRDALAYCELVFDQNNKPIDFIYLEVNKAFEIITGIKQEATIGKKATELLPGFIESYSHLFNIYIDVALTGSQAKLEVFFEPKGQWLTISVYSPKSGYFVAIFDDITDRKQAEEILHKLRTLCGCLPNCCSIS
ncbi:MAG: PAS domain S-box protein [Desulfamplus sp.]|nr:PAS domain S-box protein [Desulfamplus sp.]